MLTSFTGPRGECVKSGGLGFCWQWGSRCPARFNSNSCHNCQRIEKRLIRDTLTSVSHAVLLSAALLPNAWNVSFLSNPPNSNSQTNYSKWPLTVWFWFILSSVPSLHLIYLCKVCWESCLEIKCIVIIVSYKYHHHWGKSARHYSAFYNNVIRFLLGFFLA